MTSPKHAMEVFQVLDKSNCRECGEKTCLAFAGAVYQRRRLITECTHLDRKTMERFLPAPDARGPQEGGDFFEALKKQAAGLDFHEAAERIGGRTDGERLTIKILGKDFSIDRNGTLHSELHMLPWVISPFLSYVLQCRGRRLSGEWASFREFSGGAERYPLFNKRIELAMQQIADRYTDLFSDLAELFQGRQIVSPFDSDISVVLPVFPLAPLMICYWRPDEGMESDLLLFFDRSADDNIGIESAYTMAAGLTQMFEKLAQRHGIALDQSRVPSSL